MAVCLVAVQLLAHGQGGAFDRRGSGWIQAGRAVFHTGLDFPRGEGPRACCHGSVGCGREGPWQH